MQIQATPFLIDLDMKYIDADLLRKEIERELSAHDKVDHLEAFEVGKAWNRGHRCALENLLSFIASLQQEQLSLPDNLDEAAEEELDDVDANWQIDERDDGCTEPGYNQKQMLLM